MGDKIDNNQRDVKFNGIGDVPFPNASPSLKQREEQAFYEANSCDDGRVVLWLAGKFRTIAKMVTKLLKGK